MKAKLFIVAVAVLVCNGHAAVLLSGPQQPGTSGAGSSFNPQFSADGQHLVFVSHANNLVLNDDLNRQLDVFVCDLVNSNMALVSVNVGGIGGANADANYPSISSNGQFIAFASRASNLVGGDANNAIDVFVRDMNAGLTRLVSVNVSGTSPADPSPSSIIPLSSNPLISADGRWVFFESRATNLIVSGAPLGSVNIYARDTWSNATVLVTAATNGGALAGISTLAGITPDGRLAAFTTTNNTVVPGVTNTGGDVYVRDLTSGWISWASRGMPLRFGLSYHSALPALSANGRFIAFLAGAAVDQAFRYDLLSSNTLRISAHLVGTEPTSDATNKGNPLQITADGSRIAFEAEKNVYVWDINVGSGAQRINFCDACDCLAPGGGQPGPDPSSRPWLSSDGHYVVFFSPCANDFYRRDLLTGTNEWITAASSASQIAFSVLDGDSMGSRFAFDTAAAISTGDLNGASDIFLRDMNAGATKLITKAQPAKPAVTSFAHSFLGPNSVSADGRFIVSTRYDDPSADRDTNGWADVFVSDVLSNRTVAVSINSNLFVTSFNAESGPFGSFIENTNAYQSPIISADGSVVVAVRYGLRGSYTNIVHARATNGTFASSGLTLAVRPAPNASPDYSSDSPVVSADGRLLVFRSDQSQFSQDVYDGNNASDIWIRFPARNYYGMLQTNYGLLSAGNRDGPSGNGPSFAPSMSADAGTVAFATQAGDLLSEAAGGTIGQTPYANYQIVAALLGTNQLATNYLSSIPKRLCSYTISFQQYEWFDAYDTNIHHTNLNSVLTPIPTGSTNAVFSGNGRYLIYSLADGSAIWRHNLSATRTNYNFFSNAQYPGVNVSTNLVPAESNLLVCVNCRNPVVSADGNIVSYERVRSASAVDVFAKDMNTGEETLTSGNLFGAFANGSSGSPVISADGRYVVFASKGSDLVANDTNGVSDIFVRDRLLGITMLVSANSQGRAADGPSTRPVLAADGRTVVFQSFARDLVSGDYNEKRDIFVLKLGGADTDGDGMDDDWEVTYFNNLSRTGDGDFDGDGVNDRDEFLAGTNPTANASIFRLLTVTPAGGGTALVMWAGNPNRNYRVDFKDDLNAVDWTPLANGISWNGTTASIADTNANTSTHRYYRAVRLP